MKLRGAGTGARPPARAGCRRQRPARPYLAATGLRVRFGQGACVPAGGLNSERSSVARLRPWTCSDRGGRIGRARGGRADLVDEAVEQGGLPCGSSRFGVARRLAWGAMGGNESAGSRSPGAALAGGVDVVRDGCCRPEAVVGGLWAVRPEAVVRVMNADGSHRLHSSPDSVGR